MKKLFVILLTLILLISALSSCEKDTEEARLLSFSQSNSVEEMKKLDGKKVTVIGYMSTLSPVSGKFMYLMNLPYQSCPFCIPNTTELSNTMAVYSKGSSEFEFTDRAIRVTGVLEFGDYTDEFGYQYSYRIKDATYEILDTSNMSEELKLWQQLASTDVISEIYNMFEYLNFLCYWPTYTVEFESGKDYLYPEDALRFIETDGAQYNYGFKSDYFDNIVKTIESVDKTAFSELVKTVRDAEELCDKAYNELKNGGYTQTTEYSNVFKDERVQYKVNLEKELEDGMETMYSAFSNWLAEWEL